MTFKHSGHRLSVCFISSKGPSHHETWKFLEDRDFNLLLIFLLGVVNILVIASIFRSRKPHPSEFILTLCRWKDGEVNIGVVSSRSFI